MENLFDIKGKVVVMTGACGVLGATIVKYFAAQGAKVALLDLDRAAEKGEAIVAEIKAEGGEACFLATNVLDKDTLEANCKEIVAKFGGIDILLNAAGGNMAAATVPPEKTIFDLDVEAVRKVVDLNLFGTILPTMVFAKAMVGKKKGSIIKLLQRDFTQASHTCGRLWCGQGRCGQLDQVSGRRACDKVRRGLQGQRHRSGIPAHEPEPFPAHES